MTARTNRGGLFRLWLLNFIGNAAALAAWYFWLLVPDAHGWQVAGSAVGAVCIILLVVWLRAGTFAYFRLPGFRESGKVWRAFRHSLRHIGPLILWGILLGLVLWFLIWLRAYPLQFGVWLWQKLPESSRIGTPRQLTRAAEWLVWLFTLVIMPAIWLPIATTISASGFATGLARSWRVLWRPTYWVRFCVLVFAGAYIPYKLVWWIPNFDNLREQGWSMGLRFFTAYIILTTAWIALVWMIGVCVEMEFGERSIG